jgi:hypothetical protein
VTAPPAPLAPPSSLAEGGFATEGLVRQVVEVKIDSVEYLIMKESDVMGVLVDEKSHKRAP